MSKEIDRLFNLVQDELFNLEGKLNNSEFIIGILEIPIISLGSVSASEKIYDLIKRDEINNLDLLRRISLKLTIDNVSIDYLSGLLSGKSFFSDTDFNEVYIEFNVSFLETIIGLIQLLKMHVKRYLLEHNV